MFEGRPFTLKRCLCDGGWMRVWEDDRVIRRPCDQCGGTGYERIYGAFDPSVKTETQVALEDDQAAAK